jgi:hypothetical protein
MKKAFVFLFITTIILQSCKPKQTEHLASKNQNKRFINDVNKNPSIQSSNYCKVKIGNDVDFSEYQLRSSNALRKGTITTTFNLRTNENFYEKYLLDISFTRVEKTQDPKLKTGIYQLKTLTLEAQEATSYFGVGENIIDKKTYENAKASNLLETIQDSYLLLSDESNFFNIDAVSDVGQIENSNYYTTGKQQIKGTATLFLLRIATNKKLTIHIDFNVEHEWSISK